MVAKPKRQSAWNRSKAKLGNFFKRSKQFLGNVYKRSGLKSLAQRSKNKLSSWKNSISNKYKNSRLKRSLDKLVRSIRKSLGKKNRQPRASASTRRLTVSRV